MPSIRRFSRPYWSLVVLLLSIGLAAPVVTRAQTAPPAQTVLRATLQNGMRVVIVRNPLSSAVTTEVNYLVGSNEAPAGFPGTAHAQEHMMFRGGPGLSAAQLAEVTAAMGGMFDADTQQTVTQYYFTVPAEDLNAALHVEAARMRAIGDKQSAWAKERKAIDQEVAQDVSNPEYVFYTRLLHTLFAGTPYAEDALGTRESFAHTTGAMLAQFHDHWYTPNNAILVIVGDVEPEAALAKVKALFGTIPSKRLPPRPAVHLQPVKPATLHMTTDTPYGLAVVAFRLPGSDSPDYAASQVLADVLNNQRGNLYGLVPAGKALYAGFANDAWPETGMGYVVAAYPASANGATLMNEVKGVLRHDLADGFPADLVAASKRHEVTQAEFEKNSVAGLASAWSQALAVEHRHSPEDDVRAIERVTPADVNRVARTYLDLNHSVVAILKPQPSGAPVSSKLAGHHESFAPKHVKPVALPPWAQRALARLSLPQWTLHPTLTTLPNGIKLIVQPESVSNTVSVYGHIRSNADLETPVGQEGVNEVLDQLFNYGTTSLDRRAFAKALDDIGADEGAGTDFSLHVLPAHFDRGVALLADNELHPAMPTHAFKIVQRETASDIAGRLHSADYLTERAANADLFPPHDPTQRQATPATISALTLKDVADYYHRAYRPDLTTIVVIGNITTAQAKATIAKYFGGWRAQGPRPHTTLPPAPLNHAAMTAVPDRSRVQDKVMLAETLGLNRYQPDYYALQLGNHVLGGAFYATRLYRDLRENGGLVYFVDSNFNVGRSRGIYTVSYACDPPNVGHARAIIEHDLQDMREHDVTPDELHQAKALMLREIPLSNASVSGIAEGYLARMDLKLPLDEPEREARRYLALNADQVRKAFAKWIDVKRLVQVSEGPAPH